MNTPGNRLLVAAGALAILASGCGTSRGPTAEETTTTLHQHSASAGMSDALATPAADVADAVLVEGTFSVLLGSQGQGTGTAWIARHTDGTTVTVAFGSLKPLTQFVSHVHVASCREAGGDHYQFEPGGDHHPPNEIHLSISSDADGSAETTVTTDRVAGDDAVSIVVHEASDDAPKILCADLSTSPK